MNAPYTVKGSSGEWEVVVGLEIEERAGFTARPEKWW
jgi:hypothetical protein